MSRLLVVSAVLSVVVATPLALAGDAKYKGKNAAHWMALLDGDDITKQRQAAYALWHLNDPACAPALARAVGSDDDYVRATAAKSLARLGADARAAIPRLGKLLSDDRVVVRRKAAETCYRLGSVAVEVVGPLSLSLNSDDPLVRAYAASALGNVGRAASDAFTALESLLDDVEEDVRNSAARAIARIDQERALQSTRENVRLSAIRALANTLGKHVSPASVPILITLLEDKSEQVRASAANLLGNCLPHRARLFPKGTDTLERVLLARYPVEPSVEVRIWMVYSFGRLPKIAETTVPWLTANFTSSNEDLRRRSLSAAFELREKAVTPSALKATLHADPATRQLAVMVLGSCGVEEAKTLDAIERALDDQHPRVRTSAVRALVEILGLRAVPSLIRSIQKWSDRSTRQSAVMEIARVGPAASKAVPTLDGLLTSDEPAVRVAAAYALLAIAAERAPKAHGVLVDGALHEQESVRNFSNNCLRKLAERAEPLVGRLLDELKRGSPQRSHAIRALGSIGPSARMATTSLLKHPDPAVRDAASSALRRIADDPGR